MSRSPSKAEKERDRRRYSGRRLVLPGFPWRGQFQTRKQVDEYLGGERIVCLLCGKAFKGLDGHIWNIHGIDIKQYKRRYGLPMGRSLARKETVEKCSHNLKNRIMDGVLRPPGNLCDIVRKFWSDAKQNGYEKYTPPFARVELSEGLRKRRYFDTLNRAKNFYIFVMAW